MHSEEIGKRLKEIRKEHHFTIRATASALNISEEYWGRLERGKEMPSLKLLVIFSNLFQVSADYILYGSQPKGSLDKSSDIEIPNLEKFSQHDLQVVADMFYLYYQNEQNRQENQQSLSAVSFAKRLRFYRKKAGLTRKALAEKTGINQTHLRQIELGMVIPTLNTLDKIVAVLGIPIDGLLADCLYAGKAIIIKDILNTYQKFTPGQRKIAKNIVEAYLNSIEKTTDK